MKEKPLLLRLPADIAYEEMMVEQLKAHGPTRPKVAILDRTQISSAEYNAAILAMQPASTRATLMRTADEQAAWLSRPISTEGQTTAATRLEDLEKLVPARPVTLEEISLIEGIRRRPKNSIGQAEDSAFTPERRQAAAHAFAYSPPAALTEAEKAKVSQIEAYEKPPVVSAKAESITPEVKKHWSEWFRAPLYWFRGHE